MTKALLGPANVFFEVDLSTLSTPPTPPSGRFLFCAHPIVNAFLLELNHLAELISSVQSS